MSTPNHWDQRWRDLLYLVQSWSEDPTTKFSALIIDPINNNLRSIGFNGLPRGIAYSAQKHGGPDKYNYFVHAEVNAIINAGGMVPGSTIYLLAPPCSNCAGAIIQSGITRVKYDAPHEETSPRWLELSTGWRASIQDAILLLAEARVEISRIEEA